MVGKTESLPCWWKNSQSRLLRVYCSLEGSILILKALEDLQNNPVCIHNPEMCIQKSHCMQWGLLTDKEENCTGPIMTCFHGGRGEILSKGQNTAFAWLKTKLCKNGGGTGRFFLWFLFLYFTIQYTYWISNTSQINNHFLKQRNSWYCGPCQLLIKHLIVYKIVTAGSY